LKSCTSVKNTLATVSAIVSQSLRNVEGVDHAQQAIEGRLLALGRAHDLLLQTKRSSADLGTVVRSAIEAFDDRHESKFSISGPDIRINSGAVVAVAMTLNELCTNAVKHGAFSGPKGRVDLHWTIDQQTQRLHLSWTEKDGPLIRQLVKRSFGTRLIETLGRQLQGNVQLTYAESGFAYTFDVPLASLNVPTPA
jgi:two-component sensor histidine kinase